MEYMYSMSGSVLEMKINSKEINIVLTAVRDQICPNYFPTPVKMRSGSSHGAVLNANLLRFPKISVIAVK